MAGDGHMDGRTHIWGLMNMEVMGQFGKFEMGVVAYIILTTHVGAYGLYLSNCYG